MLRWASLGQTVNIPGHPCSGKKAFVRRGELVPVEEEVCYRKKEEEGEEEKENNSNKNNNNNYYYY